MYESKRFRNQCDSGHQFICAFMYLCIRASEYLWICISAHLCICVFVYVSISVSVHLNSRICVCVSVYPYICASVYLKYNMCAKGVHVLAGVGNREYIEGRSNSSEAVRFYESAILMARQRE